MIDHAAPTRRLGRAWAAVATRRGWLPPRAAPLTLRQAWPRRRAHVLSCALLWTIVAAYAGVWIHAHWGYLTDTMLQNDDARTSLFPFHRYGPEETLADDPIADEMLFISPPAQLLLYRVFVPLTDLYTASKVIQVLCLLVVAAASVVLLRARRGGLAAALLLLFFALHTPYVVNRIGGGHSRGFAFGLLALWIAGAIAPAPRVRYGTTLAAAIVYPPMVLILLAAEGMLALMRLPPLADAGAVARRLKPCALLAALCVAAVVPQMIRNHGYGRVHTLAEARESPAFFYSDRPVLPFADPVPYGARHFVHPFAAAGPSPVPAIGAAYAQAASTGPLVVLALFLFLVATRRLPPPRPAVALLCGSIVVYVAAVVLAFRLYNPHRYLTFGMVGGGIALVVSTVGCLWPACRPRWRRATRRNLAAAAVIAATWIVAGDGAVADFEPSPDGVVGHNGMSIDGRDEADLYSFIRALPPDSRLLVHPMDGAGVSYWTGRATTYHHETLQPWLVEPWRRARERTVESLAAFYATDPAVLLDYCDRYAVTHLLVNTARFDEQDFRTNALVFPPFDEAVNALLDGVDQDDLVVPQVTHDAYVFYRQPWIILDVARIRTAVAAREKAPSSTALGAPIEVRE